MLFLKKKNYLTNAMLIPDGGCDFPEEWDSLWYDSNHGEISINRNESAVSSGWSLSVFGTDVTSWTCFAQNTTSNYLLFK